MPLLEAYVIGNIATQNLFGGTPIQFLLGDLNASGGTTGLAQLMGPQPGVITIKELLTGEMNTAMTTSGWGASPTNPKGSTKTTYGTSGGVLEAVSKNFADNFGTIIISSALSTAGFRIANKVLAKPKNKMNQLLRSFNLGSTIQI